MRSWGESAAGGPTWMPPNYQNGYSQKTVKPQLDEIDIKVPRDRHGNYEPKIISKYGRNVEGMEDKILSLYACGMSQRDIAEQIKGNGRSVILRILLRLS